MVQLNKIKEFLKKKILGIIERERILSLKYYFNEIKNKEKEEKINEEIEALDDDLKHYRKLLHEDVKISQKMLQEMKVWRNLLLHVYKSGKILVFIKKLIIEKFLKKDLLKFYTFNIF